MLVLVFSASFLWAQQTTGKISGQVKATDGSGLAGANVQIDGTAMGAATDAEGSYTILNVPAGNYSLTASYIGYKNTTTSNVEVKTKMAQSFNISTEKLDEFVNNYLK